MMQTQLVKKAAIIDSGDFNLSAARYLEKVEINSIFDFVTIGETCNIVNGSTPKKDNNLFWDNGSIPWFTIDDIRKQGYKIKETSKYTTKFALDNTSLKLIPPNTTLICCTASVGVCAYNEIELTTNQQFNALIINEDYQSKLDSKFLFWISTNLKDELLRLSGKTSFDFISGKNLKKISIPLPPLEIQEQIVKEVEGYQQIIDGCRQVVENYKPIIDIDESWEIVSLKKIIKLSSGKGLSKKDFISGKYNVYGGNGIIATHNKFFLNDPTVVIGRVGAYCGAVHTTSSNSWVTDNGLYVKEFLKEIEIVYLNTILNQMNLNKYSKVGGQPSISQSEILKLRIPFPEIKIQQEIVEKLEHERKVIEGNKELIKIYEDKINARINKVWSDN